MTHTHKILAVAGLLATPLFAAQEPAIPVGKLIVDSALVRSGDTPTLEWQITHPKSITDIVTIDPGTETVTTKTDLIAKVSVIGVGITDGYYEYAAASSIKFGSGAWESIYYGVGSNVDPTQVLIEKEIPSGTDISFAAYYDSWRYNSDAAISVLKDGDTPPSYAAGYQDQSSAEEYIQPYIQDGKISLGPLDIIYTAELTHSDPNGWGYDMQDTIVLVRFEEVNTAIGSDKGEGADSINGGESVNNHNEIAQNQNNNGNGGQQGNNGWGNGDQNAPGNSLENNNAENAQGNTGSGNSGNGGQQGNNGWGNGDQDAPGNSLENNNAENAQGTKGNGQGNSNGNGKP